MGGAPDDRCDLALETKQFGTLRARDLTGSGQGAGRLEEVGGVFGGVAALRRSGGETEVYRDNFAGTGAECGGDYIQGEPPITSSMK